MCFKEDGAEYMYNYYSLFFCRVLLKYYMSFMKVSFHKRITIHEKNICAAYPKTI